MHGGRRDDEAVPDGVLEAQFLPDMKDNATRTGVAPVAVARHPGPARPAHQWQASARPAQTSLADAAAGGGFSAPRVRRICRTRPAIAGLNLRLTYDDYVSNGFRDLNSRFISQDADG